MDLKNNWVLKQAFFSWMFYISVVYFWIIKHILIDYDNKQINKTNPNVSFRLNMALLSPFKFTSIRELKVWVSDFSSKIDSQLWEWLVIIMKHSGCQEQ
jgi:hypothetical protein